MTAYEFDTLKHHANMWVIYENEIFYVIAVNFDERLLALCKKKEAIPADEWRWVRCENVQLSKPSIVSFPRLNE